MVASHGFDRYSQFAALTEPPHDPGGTQLSFNPFSRSGQASDPDTVDFEDLDEAVDGGAWAVVDVREPHEFAVGHIPNALNLPLSRFDPSELPQGKLVVLICQAGARSKNALNQARAAGRGDVRHYAGGMNGWRSRGGDVTL
jgi:rhodanese-related sulfurtransferase